MDTMEATPAQHLVLMDPPPVRRSHHLRLDFPQVVTITARTMMALACPLSLRLIMAQALHFSVTSEQKQFVLDSSCPVSNPFVVSLRVVQNKTHHAHHSCIRIFHLPFRPYRT